MTYPANAAEETDDWAAETEARVLAEALRLAPERGWTSAMTRAAGAAAGLSQGETELLLPEGPRDLAALFWRACDAKAATALADVDPGSLKVRERIRRGVLAWLDAAMEDETAMRRLTGFLALPANAALGVRLGWASADRLWRWAGDRSTDENHYSKRALLAGILAGALLVRLSGGQEAAEAHVDRRIEAVMAFERLKGRLGGLALGERAVGALAWLRYGALRG
ncbi:MAG: COQ9 family protein [Caulobacteraceae bacterium]